MAVETREELFLLIRGHATRLRGFGVRRCGVFGSFVRGDATARSDVDLLVEFETDKKTFDNFIRLAFFLEDLLGRSVELVTPESLSPYIGPHILREVEYVPLGA
jgi:predicted nucleotidyltransferase